MKNTLVTLTFLLTALFTYAQNNVTIYGKILKPISNKVSVKSTVDPVSYNSTLLDSTTLDKDGNFKISFLWGKADKVVFKNGDENAVLFLFPGDSIEVNLDATNFDSTISFLGNGSIINNYFAIKTLESIAFQDENAKAAKSFGDMQYSHFIDSCYEDKITFFYSYFHDIGPNTSMEFLDFEIADIKYDGAATKLGYPSYHAYLNKEEKSNPVEKYYDFLNKIEVNNAKAIKSSHYLQFLDGYIRYSVKKVLDKEDANSKDVSKQNTAEAEFIQKNLEGDVKDLMYAKLVHKVIEYDSNIESGKTYLKNYSAFSQQKDRIKSLEDFLKVVLRLAPGNPAPEFACTDLNGKIVSLKDFKGKIVYLDIWASWCGPCRQEIPASKVLDEEMKGKDVAFVCVSVDQDEKMWRKTVKEQAMTGIHLISNGNSDSTISKLYNVKSIPRYIIIGKDGSIINSNASRPSSGAKEEIEKSLQ